MTDDLFGEATMAVTIKQIDEAKAASDAAFAALLEVYLHRQANPRGGPTKAEFVAAMAEASSKHGALFALLKKAGGIVQER